MSSLPHDLAPMLPSRAQEPFDSNQHVFELKWSGIRALALVEGARTTLLSQSGRDITSWFPELAGIATQVKGDQVMLDGEIVALGPDGQPDLGLIRERLCGGPVDDKVLCLFQAYDLLYTGGLSFLERPLLSRKEALPKAVARSGVAVVVDYVEDDGVALFEAAADRRLPGIVAKRKASLYRPGWRSPDWVEIPLYESGLFVVGGYALGIGRNAPVDALILGEPAMPGRLRYVGMVQGNLPGTLLERALSSLTAELCPFLSVPSVMRLVYWLRPQLVCEIKFARREPDGRLRFPVFVTLRPDLSVREAGLAQARRGRRGGRG